ncbi:MAG: hypothetical protein ACLFR1_07365 [Spirochaetia bacterium]
MSYFTLGNEGNNTIRLLEEKNKPVKNEKRVKEKSCSAGFSLKNRLPPESLKIGSDINIL